MIPSFSFSSDVMKSHLPILPGQLPMDSGSLSPVHPIVNIFPIANLNGISVYNIGLIYLRSCVEGYYRAKRNISPYYYQTPLSFLLSGLLVHESSATCHHLS
ncbi:hypothetical protein QBC45DRAFT_36444 [Copromyces sp. CBS 386.78]|nr:hypothetical protein QBC45DRAFT_36444 [Copromyces sp. CBS 386.78]